MNLDHRVRFDERDPDAADPHGRAVEGWAPKWRHDPAEDEDGQRWARFEAKSGAETFDGRTEGRQAYELVVRRDPETEAITNADRVFSYRGGIYLNITTAAPFPPDPFGFLLITATAGGSNG